MAGPGAEFDRSLLGRAFPSGSFQVTRELVDAYCYALGYDDPVHTSEAEARRRGFQGVIAPPTIVNLVVLSMVGALARELTLPSVFADLSTQAGHALECLAPIYPGDRLASSTMLREVYAKTGRTGSMTFVVWETMFVNQDRTPVVCARTSFMTRR